MVQIHVSKDPSNQPSLTFAYDPLNVKTRSSYRHDKTEIILTFLNNLKNDMIYRRIE